MITVHSSAQQKHGLPRGRRLVVAVLVCTLAGTTLVAGDADAKGSSPAKVSAKSVDLAAPHRTSSAKHWRRRGLRLLRQWRALSG